VDQKEIIKKNTCTLWDALKLLAFFLFWLGFFAGIFFSLLFIGEAAEQKNVQ
jgi:hypothetical protein